MMLQFTEVRTDFERLVHRFAFSMSGSKRVLGGLQGQPATLEGAVWHSVTAITNVSLVGGRRQKI